jgi:hypothetical protein
MMGKPHSCVFEALENAAKFIGDICKKDFRRILLNILYIILYTALQAIGIGVPAIAFVVLLVKGVTSLMRIALKKPAGLIPKPAHEQVRLASQH